VVKWPCPQPSLSGVGRASKAKPDLCKNSRLMRRTPFVVCVCLALAAARILGLHSHLVPPGAEHSIDDDEMAIVGLMLGHDHEVSHSVADAESAHMADHLSHGDVDVDVPAANTVHFSLPQSSLLVIGVALTLIALGAARTPPVAYPPFRPPKLRPRRFVIPISQAPPRAA
jgi:hypothetical protein